MNRTSHEHLPTLAPGPPPIAPVTKTVSRPKKNSTACLACKQAKRKCSGSPPCRACKDTGAECVFDETLDLRRKVAVKRTIGELEWHKDLLYSLLEALRSSHPDKVSHLLNLIRSNASLNYIASTIAATTIESSDSKTRESRGSSASDDADSAFGQLAASANHSKSRRAFLSLEKLCDTPLLKVPANPWTVVTDDDHLVSHLVSLYFTWDHPFSQLTDQRIFLEHMAAGDTNSEFCTSFLVNSLLAVASAYSDFPEVIAIGRDVNSRGQHFYDEAERLWKAEEGKVTLPNIQGVILMACFLNYQGKTNCSWLMLRQAVQLAEDFGLFQPPRLQRDQQETSTDVQRVSAITAWGVLILNLQMSMTLQRVVNLKLPVSRPYTKDNLDDDIVWIPYPRSNQIDYAKKPALLRYVMAELTDLTEIAWEIHDLLFKKAFNLDMDDLWAAANTLYYRLQCWVENLPDVLRIEEQPVPQVLFLHIKCHQKIILLFGLFVDHGNLAHASHPRLSEQAKQIRILSAREVARCLHIQRRFYGLKHISSHMLDATRSGLLALLVDLYDEQSRQAFFELCRHLVAFSRRFKAAKDVIQILESTAHRLDIELPSEAVAILVGTDFEDHDSYG